MRACVCVLGGGGVPMGAKHCHHHTNEQGCVFNVWVTVKGQVTRPWTSLSLSIYISIYL